MAKEYTRIFTILGQLPVAEQILFHNDFEDHVRLIKSGGTGDSIFELTPNLSFSGAHCLHMKTRTTGAAENDQIDAVLESHLPPSKQISLFARFRSPAFAAIKSLYFDLTFYDGTNLHRAILKYYHSVPKLVYLNSGGTETDLTHLTHILRNDSWHFLRFPINLSANTYKILQLDELSIDLTDIPFQEDTNATAVHFRTVTGFLTAGAAAAELFVDEQYLIEI